MLDSEKLLTMSLDSLFGFLLGSTLAGASVYYYILEEYKVSNELLTEDIYVRSPRFLIQVLRRSFMRHMPCSRVSWHGLYSVLLWSCSRMTKLEINC